jgi:hypothetical protein
MHSPSLLGINVSSRRFLETIEALKAALGVTGTPYHLAPRHINVWLHITMLRLFVILQFSSRGPTVITYGPSPVRVPRILTFFCGGASAEKELSSLLLAFPPVLSLTAERIWSTLQLLNDTLGCDRTDFKEVLQRHPQVLGTHHILSDKKTGTRRQV